jgi:bifunctional non-homologous end joining protein LigD
VLFAFDLLWEVYEDLRPYALTARKARLRQLVQTAGAPFACVEHFESIGAAIFRQACQLGLKAWRLNGST